MPRVLYGTFFGLKANEQGTPKPGKDETSVCQSCKKVPVSSVGNSRLLGYFVTIGIS